MPTEMFWRSDGWLVLTTRTFPDSVFPNSSARLDVVYIKSKSDREQIIHANWPLYDITSTSTTKKQLHNSKHPSRFKKPDPSLNGPPFRLLEKKCGTRGKRGPFSRERAGKREREHRRTKERKSEALQGDRRCYHNMFHYYSSFTVFSSSLSIFSFALTIHSVKFLVGDDCEWKKHRTTHTFLGFFLDHRKRSTMPEEFGSKEK